MSYALCIMQKSVLRPLLESDLHTVAIFLLGVAGYNIDIPDVNIDTLIIDS